MKPFIFLLLIFSNQALASNFVECTFMTKILKINKESISVELLSTKSLNIECKSNLGKKDISLKKIKSPTNQLKANHTFMGKRTLYSAMGPNGHISGDSWEFRLP